MMTAPGRKRGWNCSSPFFLEIAIGDSRRKRPRSLQANSAMSCRPWSILFLALKLLQLIADAPQGHNPDIISLKGGATIESAGCFDIITSSSQ